MSKEISRIVLIRHDLNVSREWEEYIFIPFQVETLRVKTALYYNDGTEAGINYLTSNLINDDALCILPDQKDTSSPGTSFNMNGRSVKGNFNFVARSFTGAVSAGAGKLYLLLEFVSV